MEREKSVVSELPSRNFQPRLYGIGAWTDNLFFAYDLVALLKPQLLVELGTDRGESYFCFCQSAAENRTGTRCVAVDTWQGDLHAGGYDETTYEEVAKHNRENYDGFSTLLRSTFDAALNNFPDASIDLLHLDGLHTEEAVRHDLENWLPKLRPGGILLMHDVAVRSRGFGVWKVWEELTGRGRSFTFTEGPGLGVWQNPPATALPDPLELLLREASAAANDLIAYYRERAQAMQARIAEQWRDGTIRETAAGRQTSIQIFHTHDGIHREEDSVFARIGHGSWKEVSIPLPADAGAAPLRVDFLSAFTVIDIAALRLTNGTSEVFVADQPAVFAQLKVAGDAERRAHPRFLRLKVTGPDPQLHLPSLTSPANAGDWRLTLRLRVSPGEAPPD